MQKRLLMITLTLIFAVVICGTVSAADIYVNDTGDDTAGNGSIDNPYKTINWGITNANSDDTINLNAGTFNTYTNSTHKDYNITINKNLNIKGAGQNQTIIDAGGKGWIFTILPGFIVNISDLTITNGKASDGTTGNPGSDGDNGGGIRNRGTLTLNNVTITNCQAGNGGNGANGGSGLLDRNGKNGGNGGNGGAIYNTGTLTLNNCVLSDNRAGNGGNGGNAYNNGILLSGGDGGDGGLGGAIYNEEILFDGVECTVTITRSTINGNYAGNGGNGGNGYNRGSGGDGGDGGAIYIGGTIVDWSYLTLTRSTLKNNVAGTRGLQGTGSSGGSNGSNGSVGGIYVNVYADATIQYNYLLNNGQYDIRKHGTDSVNARYNWWGSNYQGSSPSSRVYGNVNYSPWTTLSINANPGTIYNDQQSTVTAQFSYDVPDGIPVNFNFQGAPLGTLDTNPAYTNNGAATTTFTANTVGTSHVRATVDSQTVGPADIQINPMTDLSISKSVDNVSHPGQTINYQDNISYTITVNNTGLNPAENVVIKDTISSLLNFNPASVTSNVAFTYDWDSVNRIFTAYLTNPLNVEATAYLYLPAQVLAHNQTVNNIANVTTTTYDPTTPDETSLSFDVPPAANVDLQKEFRQTRTGSAINSAHYRDTVWAVISAHNKGPDAANITITDTPSGFTLTPVGDVNYWVSYDNGAHWTQRDGSYDPVTGEWTITIPAGSTYLLAIRGRIDQTGTVTNTAEQTYQDIYHSEPFETATATLNVQPAANINLTSLFRDNYNGSNIDTAKYHDTVWAVIRAVNAGPDAAIVVITDVPSGFTPNGTYRVNYNDGTGWHLNDGSFNLATGEWTINIPAGARYLLAICGQITATGIVNHTATQTYQNVYNWTEFESETATLNVQPAVDIAITKTITDLTPNSGINYHDLVLFTVTVKNNGPNNASGIVATDYLPGGFNYLFATTSKGTYALINDMVTWTIGTLNNGQTATLWITGVINGTGWMTNNANLTNVNEYDWNSSNNNTSLQFYVNPAADISVTESYNNYSNPGQTVNYHDYIDFTVTVTNNGPDDATGVVIRDDLPSGFIFDHATGGSYTYDSANRRLIWNVGTLTANTSAQLHIIAYVNDTGLKDNVARVTASDQFDWNILNNRYDLLFTIPPAADLSINKSVNDTHPAIGETLNYTINVTNNGPDRAYGVIVQDTIPLGLTYVGNDRGASWNPATRVLTWNVGGILGLGSGSSSTMHVYVTVDTNPQVSSITNTANVTGTRYDWNMTNNQDSETIYLPVADIQLTKNTSNPTPNVGQQFTYTITVTNNGPQTATNVTVSDLIPAGLTINSVIFTGLGSWSYDHDTGIWWIESILNGNNAQLIITVTPTASVAGTNVTNTATKTAEDQYDPTTPDTASVTVYVPSVDIAVNKTVSNSTPNYRDNVTWAINVTNNGPDNATNIVIGDVYDLGLNVLNIIVNKGMFNSATGLWTIGSLAPGESTFMLIFTQIMESNTTLNNIANLVSVDQYDWNSTNNDSTASVTVNAAPTSLTVNSPNGYNGDTVNITATLTDTAHDAPVAGKQVIITVNGQSYSGYTDANGQLTWSYQINNMLAGTYTIQVSFAGDDQYVNSSGTGTLTVNAIPTILTVENIVGNKGYSVDLKAKLWDTVHNKAVEGNLIDFYVKGVKVGSAYTDANGVAVLSYNIDLVGGTYDIDAEFIVDGQYTSSTGEGTLKVPQSSIYVLTTVSKNNPTVGETIKITFKLGNKGPDTAEDVKFTYVLSEGLELVNISGDGDYSYDPVTRTITWNLGDVPVGDPWLYVMVKVLKAGSFTIDPSVSTITYDPNLSSSIQFATVNAVEHKAHAASKTIPLQHTGLPLVGLVLAVLAVFGGLVTSKKF